jgi:GDP-4-dehydro-6-deoxy-D-mannose reductase
VATSAILVTGVSGFAGHHLVAELVRRAGGGAPPASGAPPGGGRIVGLGLGPLRAAIAPHVDYHEGELTDWAFVERVVAAARPARVVHLAALTFGRPGSPTDTRFLDVNVQGTRLLLEAVLAAGLRPRILVTSSSAVYGAAADDPITEAAPLRPQTLYAASKACQELLALAYHRAHGLDVVVTRAFNHTGPGEHPHFAASTFARQIAAAEAGSAEPLVRVGNLDAWRDFSDVRDVVRAYLAALEDGTPGEAYNVCSGEARRIGDILEILLQRARVPIAVEPDPARLAPADVPYQRGSSARLAAATGWRPAIPLATTLADLLDYWRAAEAGGT